MAKRTDSKLRSSTNYIWLDPADRLGSGASGEVFKCRHKKSGKLFAVKAFVGDAKIAKHQIRELEIVEKLCHDNVMKMVAIEPEVSGLSSQLLIMEFCAGGSVMDLIEKPEHCCGFNDDELILFILDLVAALKYLRQHGVVHRDIKPANILKYINADGQVFYKLTDFGASRGNIKADDEFSTVVGTPQYLPLNIYEAWIAKDSQDRFTAACDLWSFGVTIYHVATGRLPFRSDASSPQSRDFFRSILLKKGRGMISGVELVSGQPPVYSDSLPTDIRLTNGFRRVVTPMLRGLLENEQHLIWSFEKLYQFADQLRSTRFVELFVAQSCTFDRYYYQPDDDAAPDVTIKGRSIKRVCEIKKYVASQYRTDENDCDLLVPTLAEQINRVAKRNANDNSGGPNKSLFPCPTSADAIESVIRFASDAEVDYVTASVEHTRLRVTLSERAASKTWSASAVIGPTFNSDDTNSSIVGMGIGAQTKQYVVALSTVDRNMLTPDKTKELIDNLTARGTMISDYTAILKHLENCRESKDKEAKIAQARVASIYSSFLVSAALSDAQMLHCATVHFFLVNAESFFNLLLERANSLKEMNRGLGQTIDLLKTFLDSQKQLLEVCAEQYELPTKASQNDNLGDVFQAQVFDRLPENTPASLRVAIDKLKSVPLELSNIANMCSLQEKELNQYLPQYYNIIVTQDRLRVPWHAKVANKLCFGESLTTALPKQQAATASAQAGENAAATSQCYTLPCWKGLQTSYEQSSKLCEFQVHNKSFINNFDRVIKCDLELLKTRVAHSKNLVHSHCLARTKELHLCFLDWYAYLRDAVDSSEKLHQMIQRNESTLSEARKKIETIRDEVTKTCDRYIEDEKRNFQNRLNRLNDGEHGSARLQNGEAQTDLADAPGRGDVDLKLLEVLNQRIDLLVDEMNGMDLTMDSNDDDLFQEV